MTVVASSAQHFVQRNGDVFLASDRGDEIPRIPTGVYTVKFNPMIGFYLKAHGAFEMPTKTYGNAAERAAKVISTFKSREGKNTGVLLSGNKGSGKTMLSRIVCALAVAEDMPVLLIEEPFAGSDFNAFMNSITQPIVAFIDEFEKKYNDHDKQNGLLSLLDGTGVNNKLFMATTNDGAVSEFLLSRPSRIFYHWGYQKLEEEVLIGYCQDNLVNLNFLPQIQVLWGISTDMSFDVMQSVVEELNRYPEQDFVDLLLDMNVTLGSATKQVMRVTSAKWGEDDLNASSHMMHVDLVNVHQGNELFSIPFQLDRFEDQLAFQNALGKNGVYHYNSAIFEKYKEGTMTDEDRENLDSDFKVWLKLDFKTDSFSTTKGARFERKIDGKLFSVVIEPAKGQTEKDLLRKLFS